jgi:transcriptional regulator with XRE-family HTH domain
LQLVNYNGEVFMFDGKSNSLGEIIRRQRVVVPLTLQELASMSGVSASHLGRIERGERYPSARVLRKIAKPLGFGEDGLFTLAGYLSPQPSSAVDTEPETAPGKIDPYVAGVLAQEPVEVQLALTAILTILKNIARNIAQK